MLRITGLLIKVISWIEYLPCIHLHEGLKSQA